MKVQQKTSKVDKTYFKPERTFDRKAYFPKQNSKNWERFSKSPTQNQLKGAQGQTDKTSIQEDKELE